MEKKLYAAKLRFRSRALDDNPKLGESRRAQLRYNSACSALLVAAGQGNDTVALNESAKSELRRRALGWLRAEAAAWSRVFESGSPQERAEAMSAIRWWTRDSDLATVRGTDARAKLPEAERKEWQAFWGEYEAMMRKGDAAQAR